MVSLYVTYRLEKDSAMTQATDVKASDASKSKEGIAFFLLAFVLFPALAVTIVGGYGFIVWIYQIFTGPPGA